MLPFCRQVFFLIIQQSPCLCHNKGYLEERKSYIHTNSGTEMALKYAENNNKKIINIYDLK